MEHDKLFIKTGATVGFIGSIGAAMGNILHPQVSGGAAVAATTIANSTVWVPAHVVIAISIFMMVIGLAAFMHWLPDGMPKVWSRFGMIAAIVGVTIGIALMATDGIAAKYASLEWQAAKGEIAKEAALAVADMAGKISFGLVAMFNIFFAGFTFLFFGLAAATSNHKIAWTGYGISLVGVATIIIGFVQATLGYSTALIEILTVIAPSLITIWTAAMCVVIYSRQFIMLQK